jgi:IclR family transcriptional regulator, pca regulon regulatory protein
MVKPKRSAGSALRATDFVESLDRGLRLLQAFGDRSGPMTLSEIAAAADLPRATARRILFTLQHGGYVASDGKLFALTPHVLTLAGAYLRTNQVVAVLQPVLDQIAVAAQEISSLAVLDGDDVVFVARGSPTRIFSGGVEIGYRLPSFCTAVGRAILGRFADAELKAKLSTMKPHFRSIAVPVRRYDGTIVAAINIGAHVDRVSTEEMLKRFLPLLREGAEGVKAKLV